MWSMRRNIINRDKIVWRVCSVQVYIFTLEIAIKRSVKNQEVCPSGSRPAAVHDQRRKLSTLPVHHSITQHFLFSMS